MPYIKQDRRLVLTPRCVPAENEGDLNFQISTLLNAYMVANGISYDRMGDCTAACENAAAEFRRRVMGPYEDIKIAENGDVYNQTLWLFPDPPQTYG